MKILKNAKALSPVVASIILIAVTVAVSIAVGVWMFGLTGSFMAGAEQLKVTNVIFGSGAASQDHFNITMANTGTSPLTVSEIWVGNVQRWGITESDLTIAANSQNTTKVTFSWTSGYSYEIKVVTTKGNTVTYPVSAPYT